MAETLGLYVHIPFCDGGKCPYCDFYSLPYSTELAETYTEAVKKAASGFARQAQGRLVDTIYFGGGTPALLGRGLVSLLENLKSEFRVAGDAEITLEANPGRALGDIFGTLREAGFNRLSLGLQSGCQAELDALGRRHTPQDAARAVADAKAAGFDNYSLDLMLATPGQTIGSLRDSVDFAASLAPSHISAYILKLEPGTRFYERRETLGLPDDDEQAEFYLAACEQLAKNGFAQYEISNFCRDGRVSRHNLKYWNCEEYLGLGPSAHSFFNGRRFYYPGGFDAFLEGAAVTDDGPGGGLEEYIMLRLRLAEGILKDGLVRRYGVGFEIFDKGLLGRLEKAGYLHTDESAVALTRQGFLMSNAVISEILYNIEVKKNEL